MNGLEMFVMSCTQASWSRVVVRLARRSHHVLLCGPASALCPSHSQLLPRQRIAMKLTEANLSRLNQPSRSPSPIALWSPAEEIKNAKTEILGTLVAFERLGSQGMKQRDDADVKVDKTGEIVYTGHEFLDYDKPIFWQRQLDTIASKYKALRRSLFGPHAIYGPLEPVHIDQDAQADQDRMDEYFFQLRNKLESWPPSFRWYLCSHLLVPQLMAFR